MWSGGMTTLGAQSAAATSTRSRPTSAQSIRNSATSRSSMSGPACSAIAPPHAADRRALAGLWLASGFGGHGLNTTAMAGNIVARAIVEGDDTWRLFLPFELVWAGGRLGRAATQVHYWWFSAASGCAARRWRAARGRIAAARWPACRRAGMSRDATGARRKSRRRQCRSMRDVRRAADARVRTTRATDCRDGPEASADPRTGRSARRSRPEPATR